MINRPNSNTPSAATTYTENAQIKLLLSKIKHLREVCQSSAPSFSDTPPAGYTIARWQLALQSFNERFPAFKANYLDKGTNDLHEAEDNDDDFEIEFGPEWELKCAQKELEDLLNKESNE